jgi:1-phosphofructokinase family hexose kinase
MGCENGILELMVLCIGLNPALQRTLWFKSLNPARVNRCEKTVLSVGGKGSNVARVLVQLGVQNTLLTFLGGINGKRVKSLLQTEGINYQAVDCKSETRICSTLIDSSAGIQTELVEQGRSVIRTEVQALWQMFQNRLKGCTHIVISGSAPPGVPITLYSDMIVLAHRHGAKTILDAQAELLLKNLSANPWLAKPNIHELRAALQQPDSKIPLYDLVKELSNYGAQNILISDGAKGAWLFGDEQIHYIPPQTKALNAIGSGDAMAAGIVAADIAGESLQDSVQYGVACGVANVLTPLAGHVQKTDVAALLPKIRMETV